MQSTESTPLSDVSESDAQVEPEESSAEQSEQVSSPSWWQRIMSRGRREPEPEADQETPDESEASSSKRTLTDEDLQRLVQSEVDRREAKRRRDEETAKSKRLRDEDPWAYAEQERQQEAVAQQEANANEILANIGRAHDAVTLDPLLQRLAPEEQQRILGINGAGAGFEGRRLITDEALKALEKQWRAEGAKDAEGKLRRSQAFRKQVMAELHGTVPEPEVLPTGSARGRSAGTDYVNDLFRQQLGLHREA